MRSFKNTALCLLSLGLVVGCQTLLPMTGSIERSALTTQSAPTSIGNTVLRKLLQESYRQAFREEDANDNGTLEPRELSFMPKSFPKLDVNHDQKIDMQEAMPSDKTLELLITQLRQGYQEIFKQLDQDQDQRLVWNDITRSPLLGLFSDKLIVLRQFMEHADQAKFSYAIFEQWLSAVLLSAEQEAKATPIYPHQGKLPVLLVPGYGEPSWYFMYGIYRNLKKAGWAVEGINLFPNFATAEEAAVKVKAQAERMMKQYGTQQIELVVHSFGGLISRYYAQHMGGTKVIRNLVTIATPHHGTYMAYAGPGESAVQLRPDSDFITKLNANGLLYPPIRYTSIWSNIDEIVVPQKSAVLEGSTVYDVPWNGHLSIMFNQKTYAAIQEMLNK